MTESRIEFWFDFASTYSYPTAMRIEKLTRQHNVALAWRPFSLGPIFQAQGWNDSPFNLYAAKGRYMWKDLARICERTGLAYRRPSQFPRNGILAAKVCCAYSDEPWIGEFCERIFSENFAEDRDISDPAVVSACLADLTVATDEVMGKAINNTGKVTLRDRTAAAVKLDIFGAPSFVTRGELFWGNDRLMDAIAHAIGE